MDYESELVVVMKSTAFNITEDEALDHVLGYAAGHDVSHRGWQIDRGGQPQPQYSMGKDADGWGPWGPAIVSTNVIPDPQQLVVHTKVNGVMKQNATTADMIFGVKQLVSFFSMGITLQPGDIIFTGTCVLFFLFLFFHSPRSIVVLRVFNWVRQTPCGSRTEMLWKLERATYASLRLLFSSESSLTRYSLTRSERWRM